jgi:hypothetical protein
MSIWTKKIDVFGGRTKKPLSQLTVTDMAVICGRLMLVSFIVLASLAGIGWFLLAAT